MFSPCLKCIFSVSVQDHENSNQSLGFRLQSQKKRPIKILFSGKKVGREGRAEGEKRAGLKGGGRKGDFSPSKVGHTTQ